MHHMPNVAPKRFTDTLHMRCDAEFLAKIDDLRIAMRGQAGTVPSRADVLRELVEKQWANTPAAKRVRKS